LDSKNERLAQLIDEYIDGEMPVEEVSPFLSEISRDPELLELLEQKRDVAFSLRSLNDEAPEDLHRRIMDRIKLRDRLSAKHKGLIAAGVAAAVCIAIGGFAAGHGLMGGKNSAMNNAESYYRGESWISASLNAEKADSTGSGSAKDFDVVTGVLPLLPEEYPKNAAFYIVAANTGLGEYEVVTTRQDADGAMKAAEEKYSSVIDVSEYMECDPNAGFGVIFEEK
jgi:hypothetical protein